MGYVYWLYDDRCDNPWRHGYVGVTACLKTRLRAHRSNKNRNFKCQILFNGDINVCYELEADFRPAPGIGWNQAPGGIGGMKGYAHSEVAKRRMKDARRGWSELTVDIAREIKSAPDGIGHRILSKLYGVRESIVQRIRTGKTWVDVSVSGEARDAVSVKLKSFGARDGRGAKPSLTLDQVCEIKSVVGASKKELADLYGVHFSTIYRALQK
jgi:hypothetical protein